MHENVSVGRGQVMALPDPNDLIQTAKKGKAGFANLYQAYALRVYRYIYARVGNHQDTEDLTSQVFIAVMNGIESFGGNHNLSAWIFTIARNKVARPIPQAKTRGGTGASLPAALRPPRPASVCAGRRTGNPTAHPGERPGC